MSDSSRPGGERSRRGKARRAALVALLAVATLLVVDMATGLVYRTSTEASVVVTDPRSGTTDDLLIVFQGYASDCRATEAAFAPVLDASTALVVLCYAERGIDDDQVFTLVSEQIDHLQPRSVRILAGSLGGLVAVRFLTRYAESPWSDDLGPVALVLDTAPSGPATVRRPQWLFDLSTWYRGGIISSGAWYLISALGERPEPEPGADPGPIEQGDRANAAVGMPALTSQADYLGSFDPAEIAAIRPVVGEALYLEGTPPGDDPLIDVPAAITDWQAALPGLTSIRLPDRHGSWHVPWTSRPRETLTAAMARTG